MTMVSEGCASVVTLAGLLGSGIGYVLRVWLSRESARRKEDWDRLSQLTAHVNLLVDEVVAFFCTSMSDAEEMRKKAIHIQRMIRVTGQHTQQFCVALGDCSLLPYQKNLRQSITADGFDADVSRPVLDQSASKIHDIEIACNVLIGASNRAFAKRYRR